MVETKAFDNVLLKGYGETETGHDLTMRSGISVALMCGTYGVLVILFCLPLFAEPHAVGTRDDWDLYSCMFRHGLQHG